MQDQEIPPEAEEGEAGEDEDDVLPTVADSPLDATVSHRVAAFTARPWITAIVPTRMAEAAMEGRNARGAPVLKCRIRRAIPSRCQIARIVPPAYLLSLTIFSFRPRSRKLGANSTSKLNLLRPRKI